MTTDIALGEPSADTGRFNFVRGADGDVDFDATEAHAVVTSVLEERGGYWADPSHGSDLHRLKNLTTRTPSQAEAMVREALGPLESEQLIAGVAVSAAAARRRGRLGIDLNWTTPGGSGQSRTIEV